MSRMTQRSFALLTVLVLGVSLAPGLAAESDCMPRSSCPMMGPAKGASHCQPSDSLVADCCAMKAPPVDQTPNVRVAFSTNFDATGVAPVASRLSASGPTILVAALSPLAGKLHAIGRHTLFQSFLS